MSATRQARYFPAFLDELLNIQGYFGQSDARRGRQFVADVFEFTTSIIEPNPLAFPAYQRRGKTRFQYRRAVFRREYVIVYRITDDFLDFLFIHYTSRNPDSLPLA